jgi:hypothetical protein
MLVRANTGNACEWCRFEGSVSAWTIEKSVGQGGVNQKADVLKIQQLLNLIAPEDGGALPPLAEDGYIGPHTLRAITKFQQFYKTASDSRVDPHGPTLKKMNEVPKGALAQKNKARLARAAKAMPDLKLMASKAQSKIEAAINFVMLGEGLFNSRKPYDLADLYFAFGKQAREKTLTELQFIRTTYSRVSTVLNSPHPSVTGGDPFGVSIFTIDPLGKPWSAYSPKQRGDNDREIPEVHSGRVYLCQKLDEKVDDLVSHILFHELVHFVDDETKERQIEDAPHGYREGAMKLKHEQRMHNSDNYALFASHAHFGRERLLTSQPTLRPFVPEGT